MDANELARLRDGAQAVLDAANGYRPFDRDKLGALPKPDGSLMVVAWEAAHGHDVRTKCYAEYGCQLLEVEGAENILALLDLLDEKDGVIKMLHASREQSYENVERVLADWRTLREHVLDIDTHVTEQLSQFSDSDSQLAHRVRSADHVERSALQAGVRVQQRLFALLDNNKGTK